MQVAHIYIHFAAVKGMKAKKNPFSCFCQSYLLLFGDSNDVVSCYLFTKVVYWKCEMMLVDRKVILID